MQGSIPSNAWSAIQAAEAQTGELRVQVLRLGAVILLYANHWYQLLWGSTEVELSPEFHVQVTALVVLWCVSIFAGLAALRLGRATRRLPIATTLCDVVLITLLLICGAGPNSTLILLYFLAIAAAPLRLSLPLVWLASVGSAIGYGVVLAEYAWNDVGWQAYYAPDSPDRIPWVQQGIVLIGLLVAGLLAGQAVRQTQRLLQGLVGAWSSAAPAGEPTS